MSFLNLRGRSIERPRWTTADRRVGDFVEYLVRRGDLDRPLAQRLVDDIVAGMLLEVGDDYVGAMQRHVDEILRIRVELANRYNAVLTHFGGQTGAVPIQLPAALQPAAFRALFDELNRHLEGFETVKAHVEDALDRDALLNDVDGLRDAAEVERRSGRRRFEAEAREQARARELTGLLGEQPVPERVTNALDAFRQRYLADAPGWEVGVRRVPPYGAGAAQVAGLSELDPVFAAEGYELVITPRAGPQFRPDGVLQARGGGFVFLEWKQPFGVEPSGYYASQAGQVDLFTTMVDRARLAQQLPGCAGWAYDAGQPWLNQVMTDMVLVMRDGFDSPAGERLGPRLLDELRRRLPVGTLGELPELSRYLHPPRPEAP